jgi:hypothetical protein
LVFPAGAAVAAVPPSVYPAASHFRGCAQTSPSSPDLPPGELEGQSSDARRFGCYADGWRRRLFVVIFESDTRAGQLFDIVLLWAIVISVLVVMLDSVAGISARYGTLFNVLEWGFTLLFTVEYLGRLACVKHPVRYARSFFGIVDLVAVLPAYLALVFPGLHSLIDSGCCGCCGCSGSSNSPNTSTSTGSWAPRCRPVAARSWCSSAPCSWPSC